MSAIVTVYMRRGPRAGEGELVEVGAATERGLPELLRGLADDIEQGADTAPEAD